MKRFHAVGVILIILIMGLMILLAGRVSRVNIKSDEGAVYVKAVVTSVLDDESGGEEYGGHQKVEAKITSGEWKGTICELSNSNTYQRGAYCVENTHIIARLVIDEDEIVSGSVFNYDREGTVWLLIGLFAVSLCVVGGKKGVSSLIALIYTMLCIIFCYIPLLYVGLDAMLAAVVTAVLILCSTIFFLNGCSHKSWCAMIGTSIGVLLSGVLAYAIGHMSHLSGYNMEDVESMIYIANYTKLDVGQILYAGILISSLGAVMDVSVSVVAAMQEVYDKADSISRRDLFLSGMHVGHDMMGTMSNTLILAYVGAATGTVLTIYSYEMGYLQIMGYNSIVIEIVSGICGTIGVILTVPVQAAITALWLKKKNK